MSKKCVIIAATGTLDASGGGFAQALVVGNWGGNIIQSGDTEIKISGTVGGTVSTGNLDLTTDGSVTGLVTIDGTKGTLSGGTLICPERVYITWMLICRPVQVPHHKAISSLF